MESVTNEGEHKDQIDYALAFTFVFKDPHWVKKILIGGILLALSFLILPGLFIAGYFMRTIRKVSYGDRYGLPEWGEWGELASTGFRFSVAMLLYLLPAFLIFGGFLVLILLPSAAPKSQDGMLAASVTVLMMIMQGIFLLVGLAFSFWLPAVEIRFSEMRTIGSCFQFTDLYRFIRSNIRDYFVIFLILFGINYLAGLGMVLFFVGIFFTMFYAYMVGAHLKGQLLRISMRSTSTEAPTEASTEA